MQNALAVQLGPMGTLFGTLGLLDVCYCALNDSYQIHHPFKIGKTIPKALTLSLLPLCGHGLLSIASKRFLRKYIILHYSLAKSHSKSESCIKPPNN